MAAEENSSSRDLIYFQIAFNIVGLPIIGLLYAISPEHYVDAGMPHAIVLASPFLPWWVLVFVALQEKRRVGVAPR